MANMTPLRLAKATDFLLIKMLSERTCRHRLESFSRPLDWDVIRWIFRFKGSLLAVLRQRREATL